MNIVRTNVKIDAPFGVIRLYRRYYEPLDLSDLTLSTCDVCCCRDGQGCAALRAGIDCRDYQPANPDRRFGTLFQFDYEEAWL